jgi:hypothetical protein
MSTVAVFIALGGGAYAAAKLPTDSVGARQLKNGAVTTKKLANGSVTNQKLANNAVTGAKVMAGSLTGSQINASTLGTVPNATHASSADTATTATHASSADTATTANTLGGLAASHFVQGGGQSRSFGFTMPTSADAQAQLLSVPGFGTLNAFCGGGSSGFAEVTLQTGPQTIDRFTAGIENLSQVTAGNNALTPNTSWLEAQVSVGGVASLWEQQMLRYTTGSGSSLTTHMATINILVDVDATTCDFDASASIGPGVTGP